MYWASIFEHQEQLREDLGRLLSAGFTLNKEKIVLGASEIKYLGHYLSFIRVIPDKVEATKQYPYPRNLRGARSFCEWLVSMLDLFPNFQNQPQFEWGRSNKLHLRALKQHSVKPQ